MRWSKRDSKGRFISAAQSKEKVYAKGFKGFHKGLVCKCKQYAENTVFQERVASLCHSGMHFCENPLDVLQYYPVVDREGHLNEFTSVEALAKPQSDGKKSVTTKLRIGSRLGLRDLIKEAIIFMKRVCAKENDTNSDNRSPEQKVFHASYGKLAGGFIGECTTSQEDYDKIAITGNCNHIMTAGRCSAVVVEGSLNKLASTGTYCNMLVQGSNNRLAVTGISSKLSTTGRECRLASSGESDNILAAFGASSSIAASGGSSLLKAFGAESTIASSGYSNTLVSAGKICALASSGNYDYLVSDGGEGCTLASAGSGCRLLASGAHSVLAASGRNNWLHVTGENNVAVSAGVNGRVKGSLGCLLACVEWCGEIPVSIVSGKVDGKTLKPDTWYKVEAGKFVEA